ncbi:MAG: FHA domain-containing protein [Prochlorotrichaceae cyanobacterium]|jgi:hypothetical protein
MESCPNCHYKDNPKDSLYCEACGSELKPSQRQASVDPDFMEDMQDGNLSNDNFVFEPVISELPNDAPQDSDLQPEPRFYHEEPVISKAPNPQPSIPYSSAPVHPVKEDFPTVKPSLSSSSLIKPAVLISLRPAHINLKEFVAQEYLIDRDMMIIGHFDPELGPVDIDLSLLPGWERTSAQHAQLQWNKNSWNIQDLGSQSGIFLRSRQNQWSRITQLTPLSHSDQISIGPIQFVFYQ